MNEYSDMTGGRVLIVDDDPVVAGMLGALLAPDGYEVTEVTSGEDALAQIAERGGDALPDLVFLDIEMGDGMDGYETCRRLRENDTTRSLPVIFLSSHNELDDRLRAYDAGGSDFLPKPFDPEEVRSKARVAQQTVKRYQTHAEQTKEARYLASLVMANMDEVGYVMAFLRKLIAYETDLEIASGMLELAQQYGLDAVVQTRMVNRVLTNSVSGIDVPLETSILNHLQSMDRIFEFRQRSVFNYDHITLMVNNMPLHDPDFCGRLRDHLCFVVEAADSRLRSVEIEEQNLRNTAGIHAALASIGSTIDQIEKRHREERLTTSELMFNLDQSLTRSFVHLALTTSQENYLTELVSDFMKQLIAIFDRGEDTHLALKKLSDQLGELR